MLLLLHGWGGSLESWLPVTRDFQKEYRVIAVDFPGFGKSPEPPEDWAVAEYAALILRFIESLNADTVDIIAHSFGGRVALLLNQMAPGRVRRQIFTGCAGLPPRKTRAQKMASGAFHVLSRLLDNRASRALFGDAFINRARDKTRARFGSADYKSASPRMRGVFLRVIAQDLTPCLACVRASTLLVWGRDDTATPLWMGETMAKEIADAGLVVFENAGHFAYLQQYPRFLAVAKKFLLA